MFRIWGSYPIEVFDSIVSLAALIVAVWNALKLREVLLQIKAGREDNLSSIVVDAHAEGVVEGRSREMLRAAADARESERSDAISARKAKGDV